MNPHMFTLMNDTFMNKFNVSFVMRPPGCSIITFAVLIGDIFSMHRLIVLHGIKLYSY